MPRSLALDELNSAARTIQKIGQKTEKSFVRGLINGWRGDSNLQFRTERFINAILRRSRLELNREENSVDVNAEKWRHRSKREALIKSGKPMSPEGFDEQNRGYPDDG